MNKTIDLEENPLKTQSYLKLSLTKLFKKPTGLICLGLIVTMYGAGILAPVVTPYDYNEQNLDESRNSPSFTHWFGTDRLGRDILTRVIYGLRTTVIITITSLLGGSLLVGITMGLISGYYGKWIDGIIMRIGEVTSSFPDIFLVLLIVSTVKPRIVSSVMNWDGWIDGEALIRLGIIDYAVIAFALSIFSWFGMARLVRGQVLQIREQQYIESAIAIGASTPRVLLRHILPNILGPVIVSISTGLAGIAGAEIVLSWIGIGIQPPTPSLGVMIFENGNISVLRTNPHMILFPVGIVGLLLFTFNLLGDSLIDVFNPRTR
jgi:ABC-type dipeptide/oligopeptide/nickel transport system permease subunit